MKTVQSKDGEKMWSLEPFPNKGKESSENEINVTPSITRYNTDGINYI